MRVLIAARVRLYRDGLAQAFSRDDRFEVIGCVSTCQEALALARSLSPEVVLVEHGMPQMGLLVGQLAERGTGARVVVLGVEEVNEEILPLVEAGIAGYVTREGSIADLFANVESAARGETIASPRVVAGIMERLVTLTRERRSIQEPGSLTSRERQIADLIDQGLSNRDIARRLDIEVPTVKNHVHNILEKLHVHRRGEAVARLRAASAGSVGRPRD
ncbi:N/A [soil metagenome]|jgi:DNA-binding NarL/FixJ family response regulator